MYATLYTTFMEKFDAAVAGIGGLTSSLGEVFLAAVTLYVVIWGYLLMSGKVRDVFSDVAGRVLRVAIIGALVTNLGTYNTYVGDVFKSALPCWVIGAVGGMPCSGGSAASASSAMVGGADLVFAGGIKAASAALKNFSWTNGETYLFLLVAFACVLAAAIGSLVIFFEVALVLAKLSILVLIGPIFIGLGLFERTSHWMTGWVNASVQAVIEILLIAVASQVLLGVMTSSAVSVAGQPAWVEAMAGLITILVSMGLFLIVPSLARGIAGGGELLTGGMVMGSAFGRATASAATSAGAIAAGASAGALGAGRGASRWVGSKAREILK